MTANETGPTDGFSSNLHHPSCNHDLSCWEQTMEKMYTYFYLLLFVPGLFLNTTALWVLCKHFSKKTKAVIFMINLALADLIHVLSLPLRIYYYFTHSWPFGKGVCLLCFYLKYLNMYAAIVFLVCISMQRHLFLLKPFAARRWRRRYDLLISVVVWVFVAAACSPFILMRSSGSGGAASNATESLAQRPSANATPWSPTCSPNASAPTGNGSCFKDLPMRKISVPLAVSMISMCELFGFLLPLVCISYCSIRIAWSLNHSQPQDRQDSGAPAASMRSRLQSFTSNGQADKSHEKPANGSEKRRALQMVLSCSALFLLCFAPYHINFLLYLMVSQRFLTHCATTLAVKQFHPISLCLASMSCCLNPLLYYFLNAEFRMHLRRTSSFSNSFMSSPSSPRDGLTQAKLLRLESTCSERD
ncbi:putative P2Y purinoceptor 10 [Poeciliopsis prolifica]|uniref:putative P2Y purinoceptor 10 n=1 Tax=Poeciliopsis prolifica TaxID=188132 RepID=UPI002413C15C|nr:putative P2Y purinoceptor 10 [Poeciliopsis prolifica]XP_054890421.1 putative P2Y purinoceptor 10 [Poeciliopsis prolifica]XP_054890422.1 putative P2Y purinoceptor 10 [Poeciliopsis prolifica]XP_054890423.1 putative P2Y purinoceptor 10 [Poeciliopsis prolifica]XP_054890424.1 putative P2Y purinoceptor 10 [Poeciliopsis prolifica]